MISVRKSLLACGAAAMFALPAGAQGLFNPQDSAGPAKVIRQQTAKPAAKSAGKTAANKPRSHQATWPEAAHADLGSPAAPSWKGQIATDIRASAQIPANRKRRPRISTVSTQDPEAVPTPPSDNEGESWGSEEVAGGAPVENHTMPCDGEACSTCCQQNCCCSNFWTHRNYFFGKFLYLHATGADMSHAFQQNGTGGPGTVPQGVVGVLAPNYSPGYRLGGGYALSDCSTLSATFTAFRTHTTNAVSEVDPNNNGGVQSGVESLVLHPNTLNAANSYTLASASYAINFKLADVNYSRLLLGGAHYYLNYDLGVRYANLQQSFTQFAQFAPALGTIQTNSNIRFDGGGLRFGLDGRHQLGCSGVSFYGNAFFSAVFGQFRSNYTQTNITTTVVDANSSWTSQRVVPILDYEVGLSWTSHNEHWRLSAGYYTAFWFNTITTPQYIQAVQTANYVNLGQAIAFDGLTARAEYRF